MADYVAAVGALRARLQSQFTALPIVFPNSKVDTAHKTYRNGFVYVESRLLNETPISIGAEGQRQHRDTGEIIASVFVPRNSLIGTAEQHAQAIRAAFKTTAVADIVITRRIIGDGKPSGDNGSWFAIPVIIQWYSDRTE